MKKLLKLLALTLAAAMLLSAAALAAEEEAGGGPPKELWAQWVGWEYPIRPVEDGEPFGGGIQMEPGAGQNRHLMFYTCDWDENSEPVLTPVPAEKLEASEGLTVTSLALLADPEDENRAYYTSVTAAEWDKVYTVSYEGYSISIESRLPDVGFYSEPEAATENFVRSWGFSPTRENESLYVISIAADETHGRHVTDMALAEGVEDNAVFSLEKMEDNVYKITRNGGTNYDFFEPRLAITWLDAEGNAYTDENTGIWTCECATVLASEEPVPVYDFETFTCYDDVKDGLTDQVTMKAGEDKDIYLCFTFFTTYYEEAGAWIMRNIDAVLCEASDSALKLTPDSGHAFKLTLSCEVPGTYTINLADYHFLGAEIWAVYHADGNPYTEEEMDKFFNETGWGFNEDGELLFYNEEHEEGGAFEELFPGDTVVCNTYYDDPWYPITVTVTGEDTPAVSFTDVAEDAWYAPAAAYVSGEGFMNGNPDGTFDPAGHITAAQLSQILCNREGNPDAAEGAAFQGVDSQWYAAPILWAAGAGIITDTGDTAVVPAEALTRQQIALMLYNYMGKPESAADLTVFSDAEQVSNWAEDAVAWAVSAGVLSGSGSSGERSLNPAGTATRAETAQILMNLFA